MVEVYLCIFLHPPSPAVGDSSCAPGKSCVGSHPHPLLLQALLLLLLLAGIWPSQLLPVLSKGAFIVLQ